MSEERDALRRAVCELDGAYGAGEWRVARPRLRDNGEGAVIAGSRFRVYRHLECRGRWRMVTQGRTPQEAVLRAAARLNERAK